jgi:hypothetical protein
MKLKFTKEELTTIRTLHNLSEEDESLRFKTNKDVKKHMEVMIRITTPRVFFDVILFNSTTRSSPASSASCAVAHKSLDFMPWNPPASLNP